MCYTNQRLLYFTTCHVVSLRSASFVIFVITPPTTAFVPWWCRLCTQDSTMTILSWSGFQPICSGTSSLFSTLRLVWCSDYVVTTMSRTPLQLCTGCVCNHLPSSLQKPHSGTSSSISYSPIPSPITSDSPLCTSITPSLLLPA